MKLDKQDHHMPGWVQINVGRDLHIHGSDSAWRAVPDDCVPTSEYGPGLAFHVARFAVRTWKLVTALLWLAGGVLQLGAWVVFGALALVVWALGRVANLVLIVERQMGGAPAQLVYVPSIMRPKYEDAPLQLGAGNNVNEVQQLERDRDYSDSSN